MQEREREKEYEREKERKRKKVRSGPCVGQTVKIMRWILVRREGAGENTRTQETTRQ